MKIGKSEENEGKENRTIKSTDVRSASQQALGSSRAKSDGLGATDGRKKSSRR